MLSTQVMDDLTEQQALSAFRTLGPQSHTIAGRVLEAVFRRKRES